jgi:hypothetical protein
MDQHESYLWPVTSFADRVTKDRGKLIIAEDVLTSQEDAQKRPVCPSPAEGVSRKENV